MFRNVNVSVLLEDFENWASQMGENWKDSVLSLEIKREAYAATARVCPDKPKLLKCCKNRCMSPVECLPLAATVGRQS